MYAIRSYYDWTFELLDVYQKEIEKVARHYRLTTYRITSYNVCYTKLLRMGHQQ